MAEQTEIRHPKSSAMEQAARSPTNDYAANSPDRIGILDGLRGISILLVMAGHSVSSGKMPEALGALAAWLPGAHTGVRVFFVISGFIITHLLIKEETRFGRIDLGKFWLRRALRLLPALWAYLAFIGLFVALVPAVGVRRGEFVAALTFTTGIWKGGTWLLGHTWSLAVEQQFYLLWPLVLVAGAMRLRLGFCLLLATLGPLARALCYWSVTPGRVPPWFPCEMDCLMWGCATALILRDEALSARANRLAGHRGIELAALAMIWLPGLLVSRPSAALFSVPMGPALQAAGVALLIARTLLRESRTAAILSCAPLRSIGIISYSLYLWQQPFLQQFYRTFQFPFPGDWLCAFAFATVSFFLVERTALKLKDRFSSLASGENRPDRNKSGERELLGVELS